MSTPGVVRLKRLELDNFRGFERLALDFEPDVTVLVGANGAGKTSIIDAIVWALSGVPEVSDIRQGANKAAVRLAITTDFDPLGSGVTTASVTVEGVRTHIPNPSHDR